MLGNIIDDDLEYSRSINSTVGKVMEAVNEGLAEIENLSKITEESNIV